MEAITPLKLDTLRSKGESALGVGSQSLEAPRSSAESCLENLDSALQSLSATSITKASKLAKDCLPKVPRTFSTNPSLLLLKKDVQKFLEKLPNEKDQMPAILALIERLATPASDWRRRPPSPLETPEQLEALFPWIGRWIKLSQQVLQEKDRISPTTIQKYREDRMNLLSNTFDWVLLHPGMGQHLCRTVAFNRLRDLLRHAREQYLFEENVVKRWEDRFNLLLELHAFRKKLSGLKQNADVAECLRRLSTLKEKYPELSPLEDLATFVQSLESKNQETDPSLLQKRQWLPFLFQLAMGYAKRPISRSGKASSPPKFPSLKDLAAGSREISPNGGIIPLAWTLFHIFTRTQPQPNGTSRSAGNLAEFALRWTQAPANETLLKDEAIQETIRQFCCRLLGLTFEFPDRSLFTLRATVEKALKALEPTPVQTPRPSTPPPSSERRKRCASAVVVFDPHSRATPHSLSSSCMDLASSPTTSQCPAHHRRSPPRHVLSKLSRPGNVGRKTSPTQFTLKHYSLPPLSQSREDLLSEVHTPDSVATPSPKGSPKRKLSRSSSIEVSPRGKGQDLFWEVRHGQITANDAADVLAPAIREFLLEGMVGLTFESLMTYKYPPQTPAHHENPWFKYVQREEAIKTYFESGIVEKNGKKGQGKVLADALALTVAKLRVHDFWNGIVLLDALRNAGKVSNACEGFKDRPAWTMADQMLACIGGESAMLNNWGELRRLLTEDPKASLVPTLMLKDREAIGVIGTTTGDARHGPHSFPKPNMSCLEIIGRVRNECATWQSQIKGLVRELQAKLPPFQTSPGITWAHDRFLDILQAQPPATPKPLPSPGPSKTPPHSITGRDSPLSLCPRRGSSLRPRLPP